MLKGSYFFNIGDHGGIMVAVKYFKTEGRTNELVYSTNEGIDWKTVKFYEKPLKGGNSTLLRHQFLTMMIYSSNLKLTHYLT